MKKIITVYLLFIYTFLSAQNSNWEKLTSNSDGCHFITVILERKLVNDLSDKKSYEARAILRNPQSSYAIAINIKSTKGSWNRVTIPENGVKTVNLGGRYSINENIEYKLERREYVGLKLEHLRGDERLAKCSEGSFEIQQRDEAKGKIKSSNNGTNTNSTNNNTWNDSKSVSTQEAREYMKNGTKVPTESIYKKRQREAQEREQRAAAIERKRIQDGLDRLEKQRQSNKRKINIIDNAGKQAKNITDAMFQGIHEEAAREEAAREAYFRKQKAEKLERERRREEEYKRKKEREEAERKRKEAIEKEERRIESAQRTFFYKITDHEIPKTSTSSELYFFYFKSNHRSYGVKTITMQIAPFNLKPDSKNQLPLNSIVDSDFLSKTQYNSDLFGPYFTKQEQLFHIQKLKNSAQEIEIIVLEDLNYQYTNKLQHWEANNKKIEENLATARYKAQQKKKAEEKLKLEKIALENDNNAWKKAMSIKTKTGFENYLNNENNKLFIKEAKAYIHYSRVTKITLSEKNYEHFLKDSKYFIGLLWIEGSNLDISTFPIEVTEIETLKVLDLSYNYITVIPDEINKLKKLTSLKLGDNEIRTIPFKIGELTELERLEVFRNKITRLPSSMSKLKKLTVLDVSENNLTKFPNYILNCLELHAMDLSSNTQIDNIPQEIINLKKLNHIIVDNKFENNNEVLKQLKENNKGIKIEFKTK